jgi:hypothetical protein
MKSAYELAMERLKQSDPQTKAPSEEQKKRLAELDAIYKSKIAEREIFLTGKLHEATRQRDRAGAEQIRQQIAHERARLEEEREEKKNKVRETGG